MIKIMSSQIAHLFDTAPSRAFSKGDTLFRVGDPVIHVYLVDSGQLGLRRITETGTDMLLQVAGPTAIFAEGSVYAAQYHCDGIALRDSQCRVLPRDSFRARLGGDASLLDQWAAYLAQAVQAARARAEIRGLKTVAQRLDMWLTLGSGAMPPKGQRQTVAAELGVSREALYREVARRADRAALAKKTPKASTR